MTGYDFDRTIYRGYSFIDFYFFCLRRRFWLALVFPFQVLFGVLTLSFTRRRLKQVFCLFLLFISDVDREMKAFWDRAQGKIGQWYLDQHREDDIVISASPRFFLAPVCERLGIKVLIATEMSARTGKVFGENIFGKAKAAAFRARFPGQRLEAFYTDSHTDFHMKEVSDKIYHVTKKGIAERTEFSNAA